MTQSKQKKIYLDFFWYGFGAIIPSLIQFIKTPIFTRHFSPEEYGYYSIATVSYKYIGAIMFAWLANCLFRYYHSYNRENRLTALYSNITFILIISNIITISFILASALIIKNECLSRLFVYCGLQMTLEQMLGLMFVIVRLNGKAMQYNILQSLRMSLAFGLLCVLAFGYNFGIESLAQSLFAIDLLLFITMMLYLHWRNISLFKYFLIARKDLLALFKYGSVNIIVGLGVFTLISSDRYIIAYFTDMHDVGIYSQIYSLGQITFSTIIAIYINAIDPNMIKNLEYKTNTLGQRLSAYMLNYVKIFLPLVVLFSYYSKAITNLLLGEAFHSGYDILPYIFMSSFLYGLSQISETKLKFENKFNYLMIGIFVPAMINILSNIIGISIWGYKFAAVSTLISYFFVLAYYLSKGGIVFFSKTETVREMYRIIIILAIEIAIDLTVRKYIYDLGLYATVIEGTILYGLIIILTYPNEWEKIKSSIINAK